MNMTSNTSNISLNEDNFRALLDTWNQHQDLRKNGSPVGELFASRTELDAVRLKARLALAS